jgi:hypothetical protein
MPEPSFRISTIFVGTGQRDVEWQHLVAVGRGGKFVHAIDIGHLRVELVDGGTDRQSVGADDGALEQSVRIALVPAFT